MSAPAMDWLALANSLDAAGETDRALAVLDVAVSADSSTNEALVLKGNLLRSRGELRRAAEVFDLLGRRDPDHPYARYLAGLLNGLSPALPDVRPSPWPSPFVRLEDFLDPVRHGDLLRLVTSEQCTFEPAAVSAMGATGSESRVDLDRRISSRLTDIAPVALWLRPLIAELLQSITVRLRIAPFTVSEIELKCNVYGDGSFFKVHSDSLNIPTRRISFVYYFHQMPKAYSGGALLIYDGDVADPTRYFTDHVTRIETLDNSIVFFPSGAYHEVTRVVSPSGRFEDARFTFSGHVHAVDGDSVVPGTSVS